MAIEPGDEIEGYLDRLAPADLKLKKILRELNGVGAAVGVVYGDSLIYSLGLGYLNDESNNSVDANTLFRIGSTSKAFTNALLSSYFDDNTIALEDSPIEHILGLTFSTEELTKNITIEDMIRHQTGIPRHDLTWLYFKTDTRDALLEKVGAHGAKYDPILSTIRYDWEY